METVTEILIDFSGSMKDKLALTKEMLLKEVIPNLDYSSRIGIKTFARQKNAPLTTQRLNLNITNKEEIVKAINSLGVPDGGTPTSAAIRASVQTLKEYTAYNKKIILVTDGEEDNGGDYVAEAKKAIAEGVDCQIHVIGIGLNVQAQKQAQDISAATKGSYSFIPYTASSAYSTTTIRSNLNNFYSAIKTAPITRQADNVIVELHTISPIKVVQEPKSLEVPNTEAKQERVEANDVQIVNDSETKEALKSIVDDIKAIKEQLLELKAGKIEIPEIIEDVELNEKIRKASEEYLFTILKKKYQDRVKWLNENGESNHDHDFEILDLDGTIEYYIECKGTVKTKQTLYLTKSEWWLFLNHTKNYQIYFVKNSFESPTHIFIDNLLDWLMKGKIVPYLKQKDIIKEERVFLTINDTTFGN